MAIADKILSVFTRSQAPAAATDQRSSTETAYPLTDSSGYLASLLGAGTKANVPVTVQSVLGVGAVLRAILCIAEGLAALSFRIYEETDGYIIPAKDHDQYYLLAKEPNPRYTKYMFFRTLIVNCLLHGSGYAAIIRNPTTSRPTGYVILKANDVSVYENPVTGDVYYIVQSPYVEGGFAAFAPSDMIHISTLSLNGITGENLIRKNADNLSISIASTDYAAAFFGNGTHMPGYIKHPGTLTKEAVDKVRNSWQKKYGGVNNAGTTGFLDEGMEYKALGLSPEDAMLIENRKFQVEEISRIFGVPLHMLNAMDRATFNNVEVMDIGFVKYTLRPWATQIEEEFTRKVLTAAEKRSMKYYCRFNLDSLMRGDTKSRADYFSKMFQIGALSPNDIRRLENLNPREGGDEYFTPLNFTTNPDAVEGENQKPNEA